MGVPSDAAAVPARIAGRLPMTTSTPAPALADRPSGPARRGPAPAPGVATDRPPAGARRAPDAWAAAGVGLLALALYVRSLLPGVGYSGDTAKWQFIGEVGGTPHPTGYPLYLALNRAWVNLVPLGSLAWRANLLSAVLGAATVAVVVLLLRALGARLAVAAATGATLAVSVTFWSQAVVAEVYTLHLLLLTGITLCLARWRAGGGDRWLRVAVVLLALSFGNHLGTVLAVPGIAWVVWGDRRRALTARNLAWAAGAAALGVAQYGYLVYMGRVGPYSEQPVRTWRDLPDFVTGGGFRDRMFAFGPGDLVSDRLPLAGRLAWGELGLLLALAAFGAWRAWHGPHRAVAAHLLALGAAACTYALGFDVPDVFVFFLPTWLVATVFLGLAAEAVAVALGPRLRDRRRLVAAGAALTCVPLVMGLVNYTRASQRGAVGVQDRMGRLFDAVGHDALIVTDNYADSEYVWYYLLGEGLGEERDLALGNQVRPADVAAFVEEGTGRLAHEARPGTPVYTATEHQAERLDAYGLTVTEVDEDVWRVEAPAR
jgi:hypothetical protein